MKLFALLSNCSSASKENSATSEESDLSQTSDEL